MEGVGDPEFKESLSGLMIAIQHVRDFLYRELTIHKEVMVDKVAHFLDGLRDGY